MNWPSTNIGGDSVFYSFSDILMLSLFLMRRARVDAIFGFGCLETSLGMTWKAWLENISSMLGYLAGLTGDIDFLTYWIFLFAVVGESWAYNDGPIGVIGVWPSSSEHDISGELFTDFFATDPLYKLDSRLALFFHGVF